MHLELWNDILIELRDEIWDNVMRCQNALFQYFVLAISHQAGNTVPEYFVIFENWEFFFYTER